jgi:hypothetical protein
MPISQTEAEDWGGKYTESWCSHEVETVEGRCLWNVDDYGPEVRLDIGSRPAWSHGINVFNLLSLQGVKLCHSLL